MRKFLILLCLVCSSLYSHSQNLGKTVDYQYQRVEDVYQAYALHASTGRLPRTLDLILFANNQLKELKSVEVQFQKNTIKIPFKKINLKLDNDDETLQQSSFNIDLTKLAKTERECESKIIFIFIDKSRFTLPFSYCAIKEYL